MSHNGRPVTRRRVLLLTYSAHPSETMESRLGWHRALEVARRHDTWVLYGDCHDRAELAALAQDAGISAHLRFVRVPDGPLSGALLQNAILFWYGYALWQRRAFLLAARLHKRHRFDLIHQVGFCGYREPGYAWRLDAPFVMGPVGGTHNFPWRYLGQIDRFGAVREVVRNAVNWWQMRFRRRVKGAYENADVVLSANTTARDDLARVLGIQSILQLETGVHDKFRTSSRERDAHGPLRILWAGRFRSWKAFPILLRALAQLPKDVRYELRVLGEGPCQRRWQALAQKLSVNTHIDWVGWPSYEETLPHYRWADVFAFTSLRDTSGAGLLESLAAGVPIIGLDHQGASDIMTHECAVPVSVRVPQQTIAEFAQAITRLAREPDLVRALSEGALRRAEHYRWSLQGKRMEDVYQIVMNRSSQGCSTAREGFPSDELGSRDAESNDEASQRRPSGRLATMVSE